MSEIPSLHDERMAARVFGAVIFIMDQNNHVLTLQEKESKASTGKKVGQYACICETRKEREDLSGNVQRALTEELGMAPHHLGEVLKPVGQTIWETGFIPGVWATVIKLRCSDPERLMNLVGIDRPPDGVEVVGFKIKEEFEALDLRSGVRNIMNKFGSEIFEK